jgi:hypothetical protein
MHIARSSLLALVATAAAAGPALAEDQLYQGTACESNSAVIRSAGRTLNNLGAAITLDCPAIHNQPLLVRAGTVSGFDGSVPDGVTCSLITRMPSGGVLGFQTQSTPVGFTGFFTLVFGAIATAPTSSVGYFCHLPGVGAQGLSTLNQYFVREL